MRTVDEKYHVITKSTSNFLAIILTFATICAVTYIVLLACADNLSSDLKGKDIYFLIGTGIFAVLSAILYFGSRITVNIKGDDRSLTILVNDRKNPIEVRTPFTLKREYCEVLTGRRARMKMLYTTLIDANGNKVVSFSAALGSIHHAPPGFVFVDTFNGGHLDISHRIYDTGKTEDIGSDINIHLKYMEMKKETEAKKNA